MTQLIDVVMVTWPNHQKRLEYFSRSLAALRTHLTASRHTLRWLCSSESERDPASDWHGDELTRICDDERIPLTFREGKASLGAAMNSAMKVSSAPLSLVVQDDFELLAPLDLSDGADFMLEHDDVDLLRYSYFTHPEQGTQFKGAIGKWRQVDIDGMWPYGDDPAMRRADFVRKVGWYLEGDRHGASESDMLLRLVASRAVICAGDRSYFGHFGQVASVPVSQEVRGRAHSR